ncbi:MAG: hypothetical protein JW731_08020 [Bacteroidales bacterium]|nr:hypothetical protein [Bacteroidales bacterium]
MITENLIRQAQEKWAQSLITIGKAKAEGSDYKSLARQMVEKLYAFHSGPVLFKPTRAADQQFRLTKEAALAYFIGDSHEFPEDGGFALQQWVEVKFENVGFLLFNDHAIAMGNYYFTAPDGNVIKVEYTLGYVQDEKNNLLINLHHSSLPFSKD